MNVVPFEFSPFFGGIISAKGLLRDEGDHLCLEFQYADEVFGIYKGKVRKIRLPLTDIANVTFRCKRFSSWSRIELKSNRLEPFASVPSASQGMVILHIRKENRDAAKALFDGLHVTVSSEST